MNLILLQRLADGAGFYAETNLKYIIVEPWNALSSLTFWIPVFYWMYKLRGRYREYVFLTWCMPLLFLGGLGSALFHAFRMYPIFLAMDVLPILILNLALIIYFWVKVLPHWSYAVILTFSMTLIQFIVFRYFAPPFSINIGYFIRGVMIFLPTLLILNKMKFKNANYLFSAIAFFILALIFRYLDKEVINWMYMGSHWLWHISTAIGAYFLAQFLYEFANFEKSQKRMGVIA